MKHTNVLLQPLRIRDPPRVFGCFPEGSRCRDEARAEAAQQQLLRVSLEENAGNPKWTLLSADADGAVCKQRGARFLQGGSQGSLLHPTLTQQPSFQLSMACLPPKQWCNCWGKNSCQWRCFHGAHSQSDHLFSVQHSHGMCGGIQLGPACSSSSGLDSGKVTPPILQQSQVLSCSTRGLQRVLKTRRAQQTEQGTRPFLLHSRPHIICMQKNLLLP